jgi:hypothetical protein
MFFGCRGGIPNPFTGLVPAFITREHAIMDATLSFVVYAQEAPVAQRHEKHLFYPFKKSPKLLAFPE